MLRKLTGLSTLLIVAVLALPASPAFADGSTSASVTGIVALSNGGSVITCNASANASWTVDAVEYTGTTTCTAIVSKIVGTADLVPGGTPKTLTKLNATSLTTPRGLIASTVGSSHTVSYTTTLTAPTGFTWQSPPPAGCTVIAGSPSKVTCSMSAGFTVS